MKEEVGFLYLTVYGAHLKLNYLSLCRQQDKQESRLVHLVNLFQNVSQNNEESDDINFIVVIYTIVTPRNPFWDNGNIFIGTV